MKRKLLMLTLSVMLVLSGCGQEADKRIGESTTAVESSTEQFSHDAAETTAASDATVTKQSSEKASTETQKLSEKTDKAEATAKPEATQKPVATAAPEATKAPASTPKTDKVQTGAGNTQTGSSTQSGKENTTAPAPTSAPVSAPVVNDPTPEPHTQCTWDGGSVTQNASCASEGIKTYTCTVCGKTKTESIARTSHNYVTETTEATCTTGGSSKTYCSICGDVQSETTTGGGLGHDFQKIYWPSEPTCMSDGYYNMVCSRCGEDGGSGTDPILPHDPVQEEICHGDCVTQTIVVTTCRSCGLELERNAHFEDEGHDWATTTSDPVWSYEAEDFVTHEITYCTKCHAKQ